MVRARPGDYFNRAAIAKDIGNIQRMYRDKGFANVEGLVRDRERRLFHGLLRLGGGR